LGSGDGIERLSSSVPSGRVIILFFVSAGKIWGEERNCTRSRASSELFSDGGLFDNSPIGVAWDIAKDNSKDFAAPKLLYINPDSYCSSEGIIKKMKFRSNVGITEYVDYFSDSFPTAHELEYKASLGKILDFDITAKSRVYYMTSLYHHLLADLHAHFCAFTRPNCACMTI
jgi:hypothetical protein